MSNVKKILFLFFIYAFLNGNPVLAAYESQCQTGQNGGTQSGCTHENDAEILEKQCPDQFDSSSCKSMPLYLNALSVSCAGKKPTGIDCTMITKNGFYGREAAKYASYFEDNLDKKTGGGNENTSCFLKSTKGWNSAPLKDCLKLPTSSDGISGIILNVFQWILLIFGFAGVAGFVVSGIMYILSRGEEDAMKKAKKAMTYSMYGIVIGLSGLVILTAAINLLSGKTTL